MFQVLSWGNLKTKTTITEVDARNFSRLSNEVEPNKCTAETKLHLG